MKHVTEVDVWDTRVMLDDPSNQKTGDVEGYHSLSPPGYLS
jgi:hypothetical protein